MIATEQLNARAALKADTTAFAAAPVSREACEVKMLGWGKQHAVRGCGREGCRTSVMIQSVIVLR